MLTFALIHSPLVGPFTWRPVAQRLQRRGFNSIVPVLVSAGVRPPYWMHHAAAVVAGLESLPAAEPTVLVGHSGAGPFLPVVRPRISHAVAGYIFVDAGVPGPDGASRLDLFESRETAERFRGQANGGLLPIWTELLGLTEDDVRQAIPDKAVREQFIAELRPTPLAVYEEPLPVFPGWPDAPCGYLKFSEVYEPDAERARRAGWPCLELAGGHFHMLAAPDAVAEALVRLAAELMPHRND